MNKKIFNNPILPGFHPDPSICRAGEDFYLINSSFTFFPGAPIFHSKDLVNWEQIGHVLDRPSQLNLDGAAYTGGIFAPTIRYNNGVFYMITTNVDNGGNFIVTAKNPEGPWSDPYWLDDAVGIDPSLFFDDNEKVYYTGTRDHSGKKYFGQQEIYIQELDLNTMKLVGERRALWDGALKTAFFVEGPHLYKVNGYYYIMVAEGGTEHFHSVTIARSKNIFGPYEANPGNPILTHRHLGKNYAITSVGHADIVETQNGQWYMVALASRPYGGYYKNLTRETFLIPMIWEDGWPIVSPGTGKVEFTYPVPNLPEHTVNVDMNFIERTLNYENVEIKLAENDFDSEVMYLKVIARGQDYSFYYGNSVDSMEILIENVDRRILCSEVAGGCSGTYICMFASSNGKESNNIADFDWFEYHGQD
ncbi:family 43 glycosylhydrolase [Clostridium sp.]